MGNLWIFLLIGLPFMVGIGWGCFDIWQRIYQRKTTTHTGITIISVTLSVTVVAAAALMMIPDFHPEYTISWLPNTSPMYLHIADSGLVSALTTSAAALLFIITGSGLTSLPGSLVLIACSAANIAFTSGHFALRYVALEIVGLCIALLPFIEQKGQNSENTSRQVYMLLRLGDAGFLISILMLMQFTGTLDISRALELSTSLPGSQQVWVVVGLLLAVWVKVGIWPFHTWLSVGNRLSPVTNGWFYQTLMPNLGLYLLYRIQPLITANEPIQDVLTWTILLAAVILFMQAVRNIRTIKATTSFQAFQGCLTVVWAAQGHLHIIPFIIFLSLQRLVFFWMQKSKPRWIDAFLSSLISLTTVTFWGYSLMVDLRDLSFALQLVTAVMVLSGGIWFVLYILLRGQINHVRKFWHAGAESMLDYHPGASKSPQRIFTQKLSGLKRWSFRLLQRDPPDKLLQGMTISVTGIGRWINKVIEQKTLEGFLRRTSNSVLDLGQWVYRAVEQNTLETLLQKGALSILDAGQWLYHWVEYASLEGFLQMLKRTVQGVSYRLQKMHTGKLRLNLVWVILCIIVVVITLA